MELNIFDNNKMSNISNAIFAICIMHCTTIVCLQANLESRSCNVDNTVIHAYIINNNFGYSYCMTVCFIPINII